MPLGEFQENLRLGEGLQIVQSTLAGRVDLRLDAPLLATKLIGP